MWLRRATGGAWTQRFKSCSLPDTSRSRPNIIHPGAPRWRMPADQLEAADIDGSSCAMQPETTTRRPHFVFCIPRTYGRAFRVLWITRGHLHAAVNDPEWGARRRCHEGSVRAVSHRALMSSDVAS